MAVFCLLSSSLKRPLGLLLLLLVIVTPADAGILVVAYVGGSQAALFDGDTYQLITTLPTGVGPHEVRVSPDGRYAYVANSGGGPQGVKGNSITVIDLRDRKVKATLSLGSYTSPHDVRVSRDGRRIWVVCAPAQTILELDSESGRILKTYKTERDGAWFLETTPDERKLYTPNLEGKSVSVIDRATGAVNVIPFDDAVYGIDRTPDGRQIWVTGPGIAVIDTATDRVVARIKTPEPEAGRIRLTADGKKAVVGFTDKVLVYDVATRAVVKEIPITASAKVITVSSDGRRAFLTNPGDKSVTVLDLVAGKQVTTFKTEHTPDGIAWADVRPPAGRK